MSDFQNEKIFVKYTDIMERYSISRSTAIRWAKAADAVYKIGCTTRIDLKKMDEFVLNHKE